MNTKLFELKPCPQCKGTGDAHHQGHDYDCPDCLGTGYEEPAKRIMNLESELNAARAEITEWRILNGWGGTPEIINDFIKGQQTRIHHAQDLETELTAVREEIERLDTAGIHSCHKDCQRPNCVLRRELKAVTEQRDRLAEALNRIANNNVQDLPETNYAYEFGRIEGIAKIALQSLTTNAEPIHGEKDA
jgi:hypothetical protein